MDAKHAEFANLFASFEKIATRRSRETGDSQSDSAKDFLSSLDEAIPKDLEPVIRNLYSLVDSHPQVQRRSRRNTVAADKFPAGTQYPFTFKKMLHDLYEMDDWKQKVQDVLQQSQSQYKSLTDLEEKEGEKEREKKKISGAEPRVRFDKDVISAGRTRRPSVVGRARSHTVTGVGKQPMSPIRPDTKVIKQHLSPTGDARVVKKRCVGRRPSIGGDIKHWVYASAVSSVEVNDGRRSPAELEVPMKKASKYAALQEEGGPRTASVRRRVVSMGGDALSVPSFPRKRRSMSNAQVSDMGDVYGQQAQAVRV
ncbi:hypothetical protein CPB85DRAFT_1434428 [Mucidula mucida]|nr:hypothetical protein CPB85DRAFT_1434428 [Mucidula mucida]